MCLNLTYLLTFKEYSVLDLQKRVHMRLSVSTIFAIGYLSLYGAYLSFNGAYCKRPSVPQGMYIPPQM